MERNSIEGKMGKGKLKAYEFPVNDGTASESSEPRKLQVPQNSTTFFFEQDLQACSKMTFPFINIGGPHIQINYGSEAELDEANTSTNLLHLCHKYSSSNKLEDKFCATSFESLISFPISKLGKNIRVLPEELEKETQNQKQQEYIVGEGVKKVADRAVVCHKLNYPYAVFYCHDVHATRAYNVPLMAQDGTKIMVPAVCHTDTSGWNPKHIAFQVLKVKPGTVPVCHFLAINTLLWYPVKS